jgi:upstream activation factor subunit UAF30
MNNITEENTNTSILNDLSLHFTQLLQNMSEFRSKITIIQNQIKTLEKVTKKKVKQLEKELNKRKSRVNRKPSGFAKPSKISDKLCSFMEQPSGSEVARTAVTQYLINYIKENNLQNEQNKKVIIPDNKLKTLLGLKDSDELNYFNLQSYMNQHFIKTK